MSSPGIAAAAGSSHGGADTQQPDVSVQSGTDSSGEVAVGLPGSGGRSTDVDEGSEQDGGGEPGWPRCWWTEPGQTLEGPLGSTPSRRVDGNEILVYEWRTCQDGPDQPPRIVERRWRRIVEIDDLIDEAIDRAPTPNPTPQLSPNATDPGRFTLPGISTWFWVPEQEWQPVTAEAVQEGYTLAAVARPDRLELAVAENRPDQQTVASCAGPGTAWQPGSPDDGTDCRHMFQWASTRTGSGAWPATLSIVWDVEWTLSGPAVALGGFLGDATFTATTTSVRVEEIQAVIGPPPRN